MVGINDEANAILFGEVKWSERPIGTNIYRALTEKARRVVWGTAGRREAFALFSRGGFTPEMRRVARQDNVLLFVQDELMA